MTKQALSQLTPVMEWEDMQPEMVDKVAIHRRLPQDDEGKKRWSG
jgi:hypothetical protein